MKRLLSLLLTLWVALYSYAYDFQYEGICYNITDAENKLVSVTSNDDDKYYKYSGEITIPSEVEFDGTTYSVNSIGNEAFRNCTTLTSVIIPESVNCIGHTAFYGCSTLTNVIIPKSVTTIEDGAFMNCFALKEVTIPESAKTIGTDLFANSGLTNFTIPNSWTSIGDRVFWYCDLESIIIPSNIKSIGVAAFQYCRALSSITIPSSVTNIGEAVFADCTRLSDVKLPNTITSIPNKSFSYCVGLNSIAIPNSVEAIGSNAFEYCSNLTEIVIPNKVKTIGDVAFQYCTKLSKISLPNSVTAINHEAFYHCSNLCELTCLAEAVPKTGPNVFGGVNCPDGTLYVPIASVGAYGAHYQWKEWGNLRGTEPEEQPTAIELTDGTTYTNGRNTELTSLTFSKTFSSSAAGNWNAFYVPMSVNVEDYAGELDFAEIYAFCAMKDTNGDGTIDANDENFLSVCPVKTGCTKPNVPYLIRPREAKTYIINSADNVLYAAAQGIVEFSTARDKFTVTGLYEPLTVVAGDNNYYVSSTGSLDYRTTGSTTVKANRWVMHRESKEYGGGSGNAAASSTYRIVAIGEDIDELTAIKMINAANESGTTNTEIYSLDGRKVNNTRSLRNGLYIKNGQIIIVK